jgi:HTH-type transcriptional regulator / antitoxin HipB
MHYIQFMDMNEIGVVIRDARKQRKLSQGQLGDLLGMSRATISGIETGKVVEVGIRKMMALCASLGLELYVGQRHKYPTLQELRQERHDKTRG